MAALIPRVLAAVNTASIATVVTLAGAASGNAWAASALKVEVQPSTPGTAEAPNPVELVASATVSADAPGALPAQLRRVELSLPDGFTTALRGVTVCDKASLERHGPASCSPASRIGSGRASFIFALGLLRVPSSTQELTVFRGSGDGILVFARITHPVATSIVLPGTIVTKPSPAGPLMTLDLTKVGNRAGGASAVATEAVVRITRAFAAGPCLAGSWTFAARLEFADGSVNEPTARAGCPTASDNTAPVLKTSVRGGSSARGVRFVVRVSEPATVRIAVERASDRHRVLKVRAKFQVGAGLSVLRIRRVHGRPLPTGRYRARIRAADAAGHLSTKRTVAFRLR